MRSAAMLTMLIVLCSCDQGRVITRSPGSDPQNQTPKTPGAAPVNGGSATPESRQAYCDGSGPPIIVTDSSASAKQLCTGEMAQVAFRYALCSCGSFGLSGGLRTDSFDDRQGPYLPENIDYAAPVGINGSVDGAGSMDVGGTLLVTGARGISLAGDGRVRGDLGCAANLSSFGGLTVDGNASIGGDLFCSEMNVGGTMRQPEGASNMGDVNAVQTETAPVSIEPPCDCAAEHLFDIAAMVAAYAETNDNADLVDPAAANGFVHDTTLEIPCGRFYLDAIRGNGELTLRVTGRAALFVGGGLDIQGGMKVELIDDAELDLFVAGDIGSNGELELGHRDAPARVRLYAATTNTIVLNGGTALSGNLYAPHALLSAQGGLEVYGSVFVRKLEVSGESIVHYDRAILEAGADCEEPTPSSQPANDPEACSSCRDCGNQACIDGVCGSCRDSADCCAPLTCVHGTCIARLK